MPPRPQSIDRFSVFALLWSVATLIHQASFTGWISEQWPLGWMLTGLASLVVIWPHRIGLLAAMVGMSVLYTFQRLPYIPNHILFEWFVNLTILAGIGLGSFEVRKRGLTGRAARDRVFETFAPTVRFELLLLYFFATLHKLNRDFFDPEVSCGGALYDMMAETLPGLHQTTWIHVGCIVATILFEAGIPLLLVFQRTRALGVLAGLGFHLILGFVPHGGVYSFSALMMALLLLFTPAELVDDLSRGLGRLLAAIPSSRYSLVYRLLAVAGVATTLGLWYWGWHRAGYRSVVKVGFAHWLTWSLILIAVFVLVLRSTPGLRRRFEVRWLPSPGLLWLFPLLVFLNGMSPYLGSKTQTSFAMFSNLRTEEGRSNHLLIPTYLQIWNLQRDTVEVVQTEDEWFGLLQKNDLRLPYFQFRLVLSTHDGDVDISYRRNGELHRLTRIDGRVTGDAALLEPPPWLAGKWLRFRPFDAGPKMGCRH